MVDEHNLNKLSTKFFHGNQIESGRLVPLHSSRNLKNYAATSKNARISTHFECIDDLFVRLIRSHDVVVGAAAWLTNPAILSALSQPKHVAIVVQKEDFLRRDAGVKAYPAWKKALHSLYSNIKPFEMSDFTETYPGQQELHPQYNSAVQNWLFDASGMFQRGGEAVRCMGYARDAAGRESPRMHHKFLVFGDQHDGLVMWPSCVVTGSFNLTHNATRSRENVVLIEDERIAHSYLSEWAQLWCMSEKLNWTQDEPTPDEMNMGT